MKKILRLKKWLQLQDNLNSWDLVTPELCMQTELEKAANVSEL